MSQPTRLSPTETLLRRRLVEATHQSIATAAVNLENLLSLDDFAWPVPAWADMDADEQLLYAAETIVALRAENAPSANWTVDVGAGEDAEPRLTGSVHEFQHGPDFNARAAMARWAQLLGGTVEEKPSGTKVQIDVRGEYRGVPVRMWSLTGAATRPAAATVSAGGAQ